MQLFSTNILRCIYVQYKEPGNEPNSACVRQLLTSWQEFHNEVQIDGILKTVVHFNYPLVISFH